MYASVDAVLDKIEKQVRKYKSRINRHKPRKAREERDYQHHIIEVMEPAEDADELIRGRKNIFQFIKKNFKYIWI